MPVRTLRLAAAAVLAALVVPLSACQPQDVAALTTSPPGDTTSTTAPATGTATPTATVTATPTATPTTAAPASAAGPTAPPTTRPTTRRPPTLPPPTAPATPRPATTAPRPTAPRPTTAPKPAAGEAAEVLALVNQERARAGCAAVHLDDRLTAAAKAHSTDMADHGYFSHTSQDGRTFVDRVRAQGYTAARSENIAAGQATPAAVMQGWMNSDGHRRNILDCSAKAMGLASARGGSYGIYWTQDFGSA